MKQLTDFPRIPLGIFPTPVHRLDRISRLLGTNIWIKRDDLSGVGLGGNKVRKLEFLLADAKRHGAETVFTTGGAQSNHAMLTAACAAKLGMKAILILKKRGVTDCRGNLFLEKLMGTDVRLLDTDDYEDIYREMDRIGRQQGRPYYRIPMGGSNALGSLGYIACAQEIAREKTSFDWLICAEGSGGTYAGLTLGARLYLPGTKTVGMTVADDPFEEITRALIREAADLLEIPDEERDADIRLRSMSGPGYAIPSPEGQEAVRLMAQEEGIFLDPVYTGKAFAGLLAMARDGSFGPDENVLFVHTGGAGGLFALDDNS